MQLRLFWLIALIGTLCGFAFNASALQSDRNQPISIEADEAEFDFETGMRTYIGNVSVIQGSLEIRGDRIEVRFKGDEIDTATAYGKPATFKQRPDGKDEDVRGRAPKMVFKQKQNRLFMYKNAVLVQTPNTIRSREIQYDLTTSKMIVKGGAGTTKEPGKKPGRARIVIQPSSEKPKP